MATRRWGFILGVGLFFYYTAALALTLKDDLFYRGDGPFIPPNLTDALATHLGVTEWACGNGGTCLSPQKPGCTVTDLRDYDPETEKVYEGDYYGTLRYQILRALKGTCEYGPDGGLKIIWCNRYALGPAKAAEPKSGWTFAKNRCLQGISDSWTNDWKNGGVSYTVHVIRVPRGATIQLKRPLLMNHWNEVNEKYGKLIVILGGEPVADTWTMRESYTEDDALYLADAPLYGVWFKQYRWYTRLQKDPKVKNSDFHLKDENGVNTRALVHVGRRIPPPDPPSHLPRKIVIQMANFELRNAPYESLQVDADHNILEHLRIVQSLYGPPGAEESIEVHVKNGECNYYIDTKGDTTVKNDQSIDLCDGSWGVNSPAVRLHGWGNTLQHLHFNVVGYPILGDPKQVAWQEVVKTAKKSQWEHIPRWGNSVADIDVRAMKSQSYSVNHWPNVSEWTPPPPTPDHYELFTDALWQELTGGDYEADKAEKAKWLSQWQPWGWNRLRLSLIAPFTPSEIRIEVYKLQRTNKVDYPGGTIATRLVKMEEHFVWYHDFLVGYTSDRPGSYQQFEKFLSKKQWAWGTHNLSLDFKPAYAGYDKPNSSYWVDETALTARDQIVIAVHTMIPVMSAYDPKTPTYQGVYTVPLSFYSDPIDLCAVDIDNDGVNQCEEAALGLSDATKNTQAEISAAAKAYKAGQPLPAPGTEGGGHRGDGGRTDGGKQERDGGANDGGSWDGDGSDDGGQGDQGDTSDAGGSGTDAGGRDGGGGEGNPCTIGYTYDASKDDCVCDIGKGWSYNPTYDECLCKGKIMPDGSCKK